MAEGSAQSKYVKLTREQDALTEDITHGELNQPIHIPQLVVEKCMECSQPLPERYQPPADEDWTSEIFGCAKHPESCWTELFCPCVLFGRIVETIREDIPWNIACVCHVLCVEGGITIATATAFFHGVVIDPRTTVLICETLLFAWWMCAMYTGLFRQSLQKRYHLRDSPCDPCMVHCILHWCGLCQEHREMKNHLSDTSSMAMTGVDPLPVQEMNSSENKDIAPPPESSSNEMAIWSWPCSRYRVD